MRTTFTLSSFLVTFALLAGCGGDEGEEEHHEEQFDTYAECYAHEFDKSGTTNAALDYCDGAMEVTHADLDACLAFYADQEVPAKGAEVHCNELFGG